MGLAPFLLLLFSLLVVAFVFHYSRLFVPWGWRLSFSCFSPFSLWLLLATTCPYLAHWAGAFPSPALLPVVVAFTCHHLRLFGLLGWRLSFSCSSPALWLLLATIRAYLAHGAGAFPSPALLPACCLLWLLLATIRASVAYRPGAFPSPAFLPSRCGFCLPPLAPIWPIGLAPFLLLLFSLLVVAFACHHSRLLSPWGWRLSFSWSSPALWLLLATIRAYLSHWAGAFPSPALLPSCCGFCLPLFASICPMGLAPFLLLLFSLLVVAFACHHSRLFGPWGWRLSFSCSSPFLLCLPHGAGAFPSPAFLPACCGFYLPPFAPIWPFPSPAFLPSCCGFCLAHGAGAFPSHAFLPAFCGFFSCHDLRLFGPLGWRLSFSCFSACLLWLLFATIRAYLAHGPGAFLLLLFSLPCGFCLLPFAAIWPTGLAPFLLMLFLPPLALIWPMGLAPFLLLLFSLLVVAFACHHSRLFGPWGWRLSFSCSSPCLLWLLLATIRTYLAHWASSCPSLAIAFALSSSFCTTFSAYCFAPWSGAHVLFLGGGFLAALAVSHFSFMFLA